MKDFRLRFLGHRLLLLALVAGVLGLFLPLLLWSVGRQWFFPALLPIPWSVRAWEPACS